MSVTVEYSYVYAYRKGQGAWNLPAPIVTVRLYHQSQSLRIRGLLDTGASISIFDSEIAQSLGIDISRLQMVPTVGLGGMQAARLFPRMRLKLGPLDTPIECRVLFMDGLKYYGRPNLIGRMDVFEHLQIGFDEASKNIYMAINSKNDQT